MVSEFSFECAAAGFFASTFGFLGLLLATPLTACGLVLVKMLYVEDVLGGSTDVQNAGVSNN
jgi:predicted PurR-regulated permease PerM